LPNLSVAVAASDADGVVAHVELYLDERLVRRESQAPFEWNTTNGDEPDPALGNLAPGQHVLRAVALDDDENSASSTVTVTVDTPTDQPFTFSSGSSAYDEAYSLAMRELSENVEDGMFIAGAGWSQLWTRDTAYAVELAASLVRPQVAKRSLERCVEQADGIGTVWLQDECGHFGGWPHLSDAIVGAQGAWAHYVVTGDKAFISWAYEITRNSLRRAERDVYDQASELFKGCSSFMESNSGYPARYRGDGWLVGQTKALSTNVLYYNGYKLGAMMGRFPTLVEHAVMIALHDGALEIWAA